MTTTRIREVPVQFGPEGGLAGILTVPETGQPELPCVVFVNAGIVSRVGPDRLYVDLARALGKAGVLAFRFDLAGLGYSMPLRGTASLDAAALLDISAAVEMLGERYGVRHVVIAGLCSGANYAIQAALSVPHVSGVVAIDPTVPRTRKGALLHTIRRLLHPATLTELALLRHPVLWQQIQLGRSSLVAQAAMGQVGGRVMPATSQEVRARFAAQMTRLVAARRHMLLVFTAGVDDVYNYRRQLFDIVPGLDFGQCLTLEYLPSSEHTVSDDTNRRRLIARLLDWVTTVVPPAGRNADDTPDGRNAPEAVELLL